MCSNFYFVRNYKQYIWLLILKEHLKNWSSSKSVTERTRIMIPNCTKLEIQKFVLDTLMGKNYNSSSMVADNIFRVDMSVSHIPSFKLIFTAVNWSSRSSGNPAC